MRAASAVCTPSGVLFCVTLACVGGDVVSRARAAEADERTQRLQMAARVHQLRVEGVPYTRIARELGLVSATRASELHSVHVDYLRELEGLGAADAHRRVQDQRYEDLLGSVWSDAMGGDLAAVRECRAILDSISSREAKVTTMISRTEGSGRVTLVAEGASDEYIRALREMS